MYEWAENGLTNMPQPSRKTALLAMPPPRARPLPVASSAAPQETVAKRSRRVFSVAEKLRIVREADACLASGERCALGAMLRREGIYSSLLGAWRVQLGAHGATNLIAKKPDHKPKLTKTHTNKQRRTTSHDHQEREEEEEEAEHEHELDRRTARHNPHSRRNSATSSERTADELAYVNLTPADGHLG